ncbi:MAG: hypothetical protein BMS9Abin05_1734 [Rhodothermia bacterium]|nr:MAG: hypothetical protein BMS9Abin05_1734 [Rhodothermia bacterium]
MGKEMIGKLTSNAVTSKAVTSKAVTSRLMAAVLLSLFLLTFASPAQSQFVEEDGYASWYNRGADGDKTASGERYDRLAMTAAHPSLPFDSMVRVTRLDNGRTVVVRINDRMESSPGHIIDLSGAAAARLGLLDVNMAKVKINVENTVNLLQIRESLASRYEPESDDEDELPLIASSDRKAATRADNSKYTLQLGVFSTQPAASSFASGFENGWVAEINEAGDTLYRVYFDRYTQEPPARKAQKQLKASGHDSFLREISL